MLPVPVVRIAPCCRGNVCGLRAAGTAAVGGGPEAPAAKEGMGDAPQGSRCRVVTERFSILLPVLVMLGLVGASVPVSDTLVLL